MDPRLLAYYDRELRYIREMGAEFARQFPKVAGRLGVDGTECQDPYVERLLEGFGFLAARVQLKLDSQFPRFTQHLLEAVYPHYLAPTPSMVIAQFEPVLDDSGLADGYLVPRGAGLRGQIAPDEQTRCEFRTAHPLTLWPLELTEAEYMGTSGALAAGGIAEARSARAGLRLRLRATAGLAFHELALERLVVHLRGGDQLPSRLYEQIVGNAQALVVRPPGRNPAWQQRIPRRAVRAVGFEEDEALLPPSPRSFSGYRLLKEYFSFSRRFHFVELGGLGPAVRRCEGSELEIVVLLDRAEPALENAIDAADFALHCTPAVNLFPKRTDRIHIGDDTTDYHVVPDRTSPMDYEVYEVTRVTGYGGTGESQRRFLPFYAVNGEVLGDETGAFFSMRREPRLLSSRQRLQGPRSSYVGTEVFLSLVDAREAPFHGELRQLGIETLCTNRDLPLLMPTGTGGADFLLESGAPVNAVRCIAGPTRPRPALLAGESTWRIINHLSLNYLSLVDNDASTGAAALRELLMLYADTSEPIHRRIVDGVQTISSAPIVRRLPSPGPITFGRGLEITVTMEEAGFEGTGVFLLGAVLEQFFRRYVAINSFTETVVRTQERGEIMRWPARLGRRPLL